MTSVSLTMGSIGCMTTTLSSDSWLDSRNLSLTIWLASTDDEEELEVEGRLCSTATTTEDVPSTDNRKSSTFLANWSGEKVRKVGGGDVLLVDFRVELEEEKEDFRFVRTLREGREGREPRLMTSS